MNSGISRLRKNSMYDATPPAIVASQKQITSRRRRSLQSKRNSRDKDFFVPDQIEEWVLPEYKSLFHHLFIKEETEDSENDQGSSKDPSPMSRQRSFSSPAGTTRPRNPRLRKISPTGSTSTSASSTGEEDGDGPLCNLVKSFPAWLKKVFNISDSERSRQQQAEAEEEEREGWLEEIPIEICDRLRHIHIYV